MRVLAVLCCLWILLSSSVAQAGYLLTQTVSVSSFDNLSGVTEYDWLSEALADMITTDLAATGKIRIVSRLELKKLLAEQQFQLTDLSSDQHVKIGQLVGAGVIVSGSYTIMGSKIRVDLKAYDVEKGVSKAAASSEGPVDEVFLVEKQLVLKFLRSLAPDIDDGTLIKMSQLPTTNSAAFEANYRGVLALDQNNKELAKSYFQRATKSDPYYQSAHSNLKQASVKLEGGALFANALGSLDAKQRQKEGLQQAYEAFRLSYLQAAVKGEPKVITDSNKPTLVSVELPLHIAANTSAIQPFFNRLDTISEGDTKVSFPTTLSSSEDKLYKENWDWLKKHNYWLNQRGFGSSSSGSYYWFSVQQQVQLMAGPNEITRAAVHLYRYKGTNLDEPQIYCKVKGKSVKSSGCKSRNSATTTLTLRFNNIPIDTVRQITEVKISPPE